MAASRPEDRVIPRACGGLSTGPPVQWGTFDTRMSVQVVCGARPPVIPGVTNTNEAWPVPLKVHPLADAFPPLPEDEKRRLAESIAQNGLRIPIMIFEGQILDGRNRHQAAELLGVELERNREFEGSFAEAVE